MDIDIADATEPLTKSEPKPGQRKRGRPRGTTNQTTQAKFAKEFGEDLNAGLKMVALVWSPRDPMCAGVLDAQSETIADSLADLLSQSARIRKVLANGLGIGKVLPLIMAVSPVIATMRMHHFTPKEKASEEFETPNNGTGWLNAMQPPGYVQGNI